MFTATLYRWSVAACPVNVFLDIPLADRLRAAAVASEDEIGGFLIGRLEGDNTIVTDFELVESEHRRGSAYALSRRDDQHLVSKLNASRKRHREVVGFFRTHRRPGLFLDAADALTLSAHFNNPQQVALLVQPAADGSAKGGFFYWEEGELDRKATQLAFPMNSAELEASAGPVAELAGAAAAKPAIVDTAETLDELPRASIRVMPLPEPVRKKEYVMPNWLKIGLVAGVAALGGYFVGTSGNREHFGSRPGDITISDATTPPPAPAPAPAPVSLAAASPNSAAPSNAAPVEKPTEVAKPALAATPAIPPKVKKVPAVAPPRHTAADDLARQNAAAAPPSAPEPAPQPVAEPAPVTNEGAFPHNPNPVPPPSEPVRTAEATVNLEAVQDGGIKHVLHIFGAKHSGQEFQPPQVVKRTTPHIPAEVAREMTREVPVDLKLKLDNTGRVSSVELLSHGSNRALVQLAGDAAYTWQFQPAQWKDHPVSSEVIAHFRFRP